MISPLVLKLCFPQEEKMLFREKRVQNFENVKDRKEFEFCSKTLGVYF